jgi:folate-binding protein YgfZ
MINSKNLCETGAGWGGFWRPAAVLRAHGEDARAFLQGQCSQDLLSAGGAAGVERAVHTLWLTPKGRVLADSFVLVAGPAEVWLVSYFSPAAELRAHLEKHIVADDVMIEDCTADWHGLALGGDGAAVWLRARAGTEPPGAGSFARATNGFVFRGRRCAGESWEWLTPAPVALPADGALAAVSADTLERMRLADGVPAVPADIGPGELPHEAGLDAAAVSYTKGCYVGQEVMARLRTGTIRRRLARVRGTGTPPPRGTALFQGAKKVGELRSTCADSAGDWLGLALLTLLQLDAAAPLAPAPDSAATIRLADGGL